MKKCRECGRPLKEGEKDLCPACRSKKKTKTNGIIKAITTTLGIVGIIFGVLSGKKPPNKF